MTDEQNAAVAFSKYILKQIEFQFSNTNLWKDFELQRIMSKTPQQWIPLSLILARSQIPVKLTDPEVVLSALRHSNKLVLDETNSLVCRKQPLPAYNANKDSKRTLYAGGLPAGSNSESVGELFKVFGSVLSVMPVCVGMGCPLSDIPFQSLETGKEFAQVPNLQPIYPIHNEISKKKHITITAQIPDLGKRAGHKFQPSRLPDYNFHAQLTTIREPA
jgi:hypothetical protein